MPDAPAQPGSDAGLEVEFRSAADAFVSAAEETVANVCSSRIPSVQIEQVLTAAIKLYACKAEAEERFPAPVSAAKVTPTEVLLVVCELLRTVNISLFDLAMWYRRRETT